MPLRSSSPYWYNNLFRTSHSLHPIKPILSTEPPTKPSTILSTYHHATTPSQHPIPIIPTTTSYQPISHQPTSRHPVRQLPSLNNFRHAREKAGGPRGLYDVTVRKLFEMFLKLLGETILPGLLVAIGLPYVENHETQKARSVQEASI